MGEPQGVRKYIYGTYSDGDMSVLVVSGGKESKRIIAEVGIEAIESETWSVLGDSLI
jgi:hypothetical protein